MDDLLAIFLVTAFFALFPIGLIIAGIVFVRLASRFHYARVELRSTDLVYVFADGTTAPVTLRSGRCRTVGDTCWVTKDGTGMTTMKPTSLGTLLIVLGCALLAIVLGFLLFFLWGIRK